MNEPPRRMGSSLFSRLGHNANASFESGLAQPDPVLASEKMAIRRRLALPNAPFQPNGRLIDLQAMMKGGLAAIGNARSRVAEEFRVIIVRALHNLRAGRASDALPNVMLVTSSIPGEGKTFTALNLAASIASNGRANVLLVDTDAKLGSLSSMLGVGNAPGLLNYAADGDTTLDDYVHQTGVAGLHFLPIGSYSATTEDGSIVRPMGTAIERISREVPGHVIVLDCAPCLSSSDAVALAPLVGQIVLVIEAERTQRSEIDMSLELVGSCQNIILVLNKMHFTTTATFGAYYPNKEA